MIDPRLEFVFEIRAEIAEGWHIGRGADEELWFTPVTGGTVSGPRFEGVVVPSSGADWSVRRGGTFQLDARYLLRHEDGSHVDIVNRGYYHASPEVDARIERGEPVAEHEYYYRTAPVFQTDAPAHRWLAEHVFVGMARGEAGRVCIRVFRLE